jgi:hypothetical protein
MGTGKSWENSAALPNSAPIRSVYLAWYSSWCSAAGMLVSICDTFNPYHVTTDVGDVQPQLSVASGVVQRNTLTWGAARDWGCR